MTVDTEAKSRRRSTKCAPRQFCSKLSVGWFRRVSFTVLKKVTYPGLSGAGVDCGTPSLRPT